jgi:nicotinate-nucleotide adenylyltransferase
MRIALFGGTFNPIHLGHLQAALEVQAGFGLDRVVFVPAALPPHKRAGEVAPAEDRLKMIALAIAENSGFAVSEVELKRPGPSFTIDTVRHFRGALAAGDRLFLIVGLDAFLEIDSWRAWRELLALVPLIVITRPPAGGGREAVGRYIRETLSEDGTAAETPAGFEAPGIEPIAFFPVTALDIASSRIRRALAAGGPPARYLVPPEVWRYILAKGLYA